jgi:hypothetical protein
MRFMMMHKTNRDSEAGLPPPPEMIASMGQLMQDMNKAGVLLAADGLHGSSRTLRLNFSAGRRRITHGPFRESNGLIAGFAIIRAASMEEAIDWATRFANIVGDVEIDIGVVKEPWDLGVAPKPAGLTTTRFMIMHKADGKSEAGVRPDAAVTASIRKLTDEMLKAGVFISAEALEPSAKAVRLNFSRGECVTTDGPFTESKELIGGFCMIQASSLDEVLVWTSRFAKIVAGAGELEIDVRQVREHAADA